jgi:hypothetical protein
LGDASDPISSPRLVHLLRREEKGANEERERWWKGKEGELSWLEDERHRAARVSVFPRLK